MTRGYVTNKKHVAKSEVKVKRSRLMFPLKLCALASVTSVHVRPITLSSMVGFENNLAQMIIIKR